jgi:hypothetical protein
LDIHKPKPWHGWREFAKELGTIVLGVLIALGAEQGVEWLHWRHEVHVAREALAYDLKRVLGWAGEGDAEGPCKAARLIEIRAALDQAQETKRLPPMGWHGGPRTNSWTMRSWAALNSGQVLPHIPNREQLILSAMATQLQALSTYKDAEAVAWSELYEMAGPGRPTSDAEIAQLRGALARAGLYGVGERNGGDAEATFVLRSGFLSQQEIDRAWKEGFAFGQKTSMCSPAMPATAETRSVRDRYMARAPRPPGQGKPDTVGVSGAVSTDR